MQTISEVMTCDVQPISPHETLHRAAQMMDELNVGSLPVCDGERLIGMVTDRDIAVRATSANVAPGNATVGDVMSTNVQWCFEDQSLDEVMKKMADAQVRRVPVISHDDARKLVGIVSLGDISTKADGRDEKQVRQTIERVSTPSEPDLSPVGKAGPAGTRGGPQQNGGDAKARPAGATAADAAHGERGEPVGIDAGVSGASGGVSATKSSVT